MKTIKFKNLHYQLLVYALIFFCTGCNYKIIQPTDKNLVHLDIQNLSGIPHFDLLIKRQLRSQLFYEGFSITDNFNGGDYSVTLLIESDQKKGAVFSDDDPILAMSVITELTSTVNLRSIKEPDVNHNEEISVQSSSRRSSKHEQADYRKTYLDLAEQLSKKVVRILVYNSSGIS